MAGYRDRSQFRSVGVSVRARDAHVPRQFSATEHSRQTGEHWSRLGELPSIAKDPGLGHKEGLDPKVAADQRGHAIGVAIGTYTTTDLESRQQAVTTLEEALKLKEAAVSALTR